MTVKVRVPRPESRYAFGIQPTFKINLTEGENILTLIKLDLEKHDIPTGNIRYLRTDWYNTNAKPQFCLEIHAIDGCIQFCEIFQDRLIVKKKELQLWCKIVNLVKHHKRPWVKEEALKAMSLIDELRTLRTERSKIKWNKATITEYFNRKCL